MKQVTQTKRSTLMKSGEEAQAYTAWIADLRSRNSLLNWLSTDLYEREGKAQTNFDLTMPSDDCDLARQLVKDPQKFEVFGLSEEYSEKELKAAIGKILKLNPSPGGQIDDSYNDQAQQIVPDFLLEYNDGELKLSMPRFSVPELRVNRKYADILIEAANTSEREKKEAAAFVKKKLDSAKWFVEAIKQRHNTLSSTMQAIVDYQREYFVDGDETPLKPMVLKDIAEKTGFDISTISRVVNSKYIETHFGIYSLKYFFSEGLENQEGEEVSTRELKKALQECVDTEDKHKPLTDDELVEQMTMKGYKVARRTIAKYRDQLGIPKARLRKEL